MYALLCKPMILPPPSPQSSDVMMMGVKTCRIVVIQPSQKEIDKFIGDEDDWNTVEKYFRNLRLDIMDEEAEELYTNYDY